MLARETQKRIIHGFPLRHAVCILALTLLSWHAGDLCVHASPPASQAIPALEYRAWTSATGDAIEAAFISLHQDQVMLKARDDRQIRIPIHRLIWRDQVLARRLAGRPGTAPFASELRSTQQEHQKHHGRIISAFGPACESLLVNAIDDGKHEILIAIYTFTSTTVAESLQRAAQRRVRIHIKYDHGQMEVGRMTELIDMLKREKNITITPVELRGRFASMHHKFAVIDQALVFTGSFNFTVTAATQSYENAVLIHSDGIAEDYTKEFEAIESR